MSDPVVLWPAIVLVGLCVGSFLNVVIHRVPKMLERQWQAQCAEMSGQEVEETPAYNLVVPRSACPSCSRPIRAHENLPIVSWLLLRGKCAGCGARISPRYPAVELLGGLAAIAVAVRFGFTPQALAAAVFLWALIALTFIDFDTQLLPDNITLPLLWGGLLANVAGLFTSLPSAVVGAVAGYLVLWVVYWAFRLLFHKEGMGYGDFKLLAALGAWLGWQALPVILLLSSGVGAVIGIGLMVARGRDRNVPLAFGPYLAIAGAITLFFGKALTGIYVP